MARSVVLAWWLVVCGCGGGGADVDAGADLGTGTDAGRTDAGAGGTDASTLDGSSIDAGTVDAGGADAGTLDAATLDAGGADAGPTTPPAVFTIVLSNIDYDEIVGSANAPYFNSLVATGALATSYADSGTHPRLPNRLFLVCGDTVYPGIVDVNPNSFPYFPADMPTLASQLDAAGLPWRAYGESMGTPCNLDAVGDYRPVSVPFLYFDSVQSAPATCAADTVDTTGLAADLAAGALRYFWITPDTTHDGSSPSTDPPTALAAADAWLAANVPPILASPGYLAGGVLFITVDQAGGRSDADHVPMLVLSPRITSPRTSATAHTHAAYLATVEDILGLPRLATVATTAPLSDLLP